MENSSVSFIATGLHAQLKLKLVRTDIQYKWKWIPQVTNLRAPSPVLQSLSAQRKPAKSLIQAV